MSPGSAPYDYAAVLLDMDGTLVDTEPTWDAVEREIMAGWGASWTAEDHARCLGGPMVRVMQYMIDRAGVSGTPAEVEARVLDLMEQRLRTEPVHWTAGAEDLLAALGAARIPLALVSASPRRLVAAVLDHIGDHHFAVTVAGDEVPRPKPDPVAYLHASAMLGLAPELCVVIEDSLVGVAAGQASGAYVVAVPHVAPVPQAARRTVVASLLEVTPATLQRWYEPA